MNLKGSKWVSQGLFILILSFISAVPSLAGSLPPTFHTFQTVNQSMWGPGPAFVFDRTNFYGLDWNKSGGVDLLGCGFVGCYGAEFNAYTSGRIGLDVGLHMEGGSVTASVPTLLLMGFPDAVHTREKLIVAALAGYGDGSLATAPPTLSAFADLVLEIRAGATGELCFVSCGSFGGDIVNIDSHTELLAFNRSNDGQLRILGDSLGLPASGTIGGYVDYDVDFPSIATTGSGSSEMVSSGNSDFIDLSANVVNIATTALGLPPLSGSLGSINYNLLSAGLGLDVGVFQNFSLRPRVHVRLDVAETGQTVFFDPTLFHGFAEIEVPLDSDLTSLHITPTFFLDGRFSNETGIALTPYVFANGGSFGVSGIGSVGPLFDLSTDLGEFPVSVYDRDFTLGGFDSFTGPTFEVVISTPEPGSLLLLGGGLAVVAIALIRKRKGFNSRSGIL